MSDVTDTVGVGRRRRERGEEAAVVDAALAEELIERAREQGIELLGEHGLLRQMTKAVLERGLAEELTEHLGYEPHERAGASNARNGSTPKRLNTEAGTVDLDVPRDRAGSFEPRLVGKGQRRLDGIDKIVIGLYARGMTVRDIRAHLIEIYDVEVSPDLISKITDAVLDEVRDWQARPLDRVYPVVFLDALVCKVRTEGVVRNRAAHLAVGIDVDGRKEVLGIWVEATEGAKFWLRVLNELRSRGVEDVLVVVCDGLTGLPAAVEAVWPAAIVQTCIVHLTRASLRWVNYKDRKKVAGPAPPDLRRSHRTGRPPRPGRLDRQRGRTPVPGNQTTLGRRLGAGHPVLRVPTPGPQGHLHHQHDREHQLPAAQDQQDPRTLPNRRRPDQTALPWLSRSRRQPDPANRRPHPRHRQLANSPQPVRP
jgi:putative transposase